MPSSDGLQRLVLVAIGALLLGGCAGDAAQLAYRQRLEAGIETPEEMVRYRTPDLERQRMVASAQDYLPQAASPLDMQLLQAAAQGRTADMKALLAEGAHVNAADAWGNTALLLVAGRGDLESTQLLLAAGARVQGMDAPLSPLSSAALHGQAQVVRLLLRKGAKVNAGGSDGISPLAHAVQLNQLAAARELLQARANVAVKDGNGSGLLHSAVLNNRVQMVALLLEFGANPNAADADGLSPLYWAEFSAQSDVAGLLVAAGADGSRRKVAIRTSQPYAFGEF